MTRPDTNAEAIVTALVDELSSRHEAPPRAKRPTLKEAARPYALPIGVVLTLVAMVAAAAVAVSGKADRADVQRLDDRLRGVEQAVYGQSEILKRIEERLPVAPPALTRTGE